MDHGFVQTAYMNRLPDLDERSSVVSAFSVYPAPPVARADWLRNSDDLHACFDLLSGSCSLWEILILRLTYLTLRAGSWHPCQLNCSVVPNLRTGKGGRQDDHSSQDIGSMSLKDGTGER